MDLKLFRITLDYAVHCPFCRETMPARDLPRHNLEKHNAIDRYRCMRCREADEACDRCHREAMFDALADFQ